MKRWGMRSATLLLTCAVLASPCVAQTGGNESNSITIGDISKVDLKGKSISQKPEYPDKRIATAKVLPRSLISLAVLMGRLTSSAFRV